MDRLGVFAVRTIPDSRRIRSWIADRNAKSAVVVGGGFIGLEMVENLIHRDLAVTVLEKLPQVMPPLDPEMAVPLKIEARVLGDYRDSRGISRALVGDTTGAIEDFEAYIDWVQKQPQYGDTKVIQQWQRSIAQRQQWIAALQAGRNPFDADTLKALREAEQ